MPVLSGNEPRFKGGTPPRSAGDDVDIRGDDSQGGGPGPVEWSGVEAAFGSSAFGLAEFMAAIRNLESGSYAGDYGAIGRRVKGDNARGAYQIMSKNWASWSSAAGIPGADWRNRGAQDKVAAHMMNRYYERYRDWDLVAVAWFAGGSNADRLVRKGWGGKAQNISSKHIRGYVNKIRGYYPGAQQFTGAADQTSPQVAYGLRTGGRSGGGVMFPLPGSEDRWSDTYGARRAGGKRRHKGADIGGRHGAPLIAVTDGVAYSGYNPTAGNYVYVVDRAKNYRYFYAHLDKRMVPQGAANGVRVAAGTQIGTVGSTGNAEGPHLHFGVYNLRENSYINPTQWLSAAKTGGSVFAAPPMQAMAGQLDGDPNNLGTPGSYEGGISYEGMLRAFFDAYGNEAAGGQRLDPRTIGLEETAGTAESLLTGGRGDAASVAAGSDEVAPVSREIEVLDLTEDEGVRV